MPRARRCDVIDEEKVGVYHCINRCIRRAYLCGRDSITGKSFDHRKAWLQSRMQKLSELFAIDVMAFAVMDNHFHVVLRNRPDTVATWSDEEVASRWLDLFPSRPVEGSCSKRLRAARLQALTGNAERICVLRRRLSSISWFMRCLAEPLARNSNKEDNCSGRFWEGRFRCQSLLDEAAIAACMAYVDLNPIRAGLANTPEESCFTSAALRIASIRRKVDAQSNDSRDSPPRAGAAAENPAGSDAMAVDEPNAADDSWLCPIPAGTPRGCLPMSLLDYLQLLDWTGRRVRSDFSRSIPATTPPILERLHLAESGWDKLMSGFADIFRTAAGQPQSLAQEADRRGQRWIRGVRTSRRLFQPA
jgi:REP element-mobilizing transposase RayT